MEEGVNISIHSRKELRKQKLMEYLKAKGKLKEPNSKPSLQIDSQVKKPATSMKVMGKENKLSERFGNGKIIAPIPAKSTLHPTRKAFSICKKDNSKAIVLPGCHLANHLNKTNKPSLRDFSNTAAKTSPSSCPLRTTESRMSLGPLVKTKTGLVAAVTQPSLNRRHTSVTEIAVARCDKVKPWVSTSVTASKSSRIITNKKTSASLPKRSDKDKVTNKQGQNKASSNQQLSKDQPLNHQKTISSLFKSATMASKHEARVPKWDNPTTQSTNGSTNPKSGLKVVKNGQQYTVPSRTSTAGAVHRTKDEQGQKNRMTTTKDEKGGRGSANVQPQQRTVAPKPVRPLGFTQQTKSAKARLPDTLVPQPDRKKQTAAQAERMKKLQEWRESKGISYKRPSMPLKPQAKQTATRPKSFWAAMKDEDEAHSLICAVDRSLADCIKLLGEGCPPEQVKAVLARLPAVSHKFAKYWICRARLLEREGNLDVLPLFEEAVSIVLEPVDELRTVVFEILKKKDEAQEAEGDEEEVDNLPAVPVTPEFNEGPAMTPKPVRALICGEKGDASVVKYKITATPGCPLSQQREPVRVKGQEVRFFTPVRRSVRIERASLRYPASLQDHDLCVASYGDLVSREDKEKIEEELASEISLAAGDSPMYVYRENDALKDKVSVKLVYEEDA